MTDNVTPLRPGDRLAVQLADAFEQICDESTARPHRLARAGLLRAAAAGQTAVDRTIARQVTRRIPDLGYEPSSAVWERAAALLDQRAENDHPPEPDNRSVAR